MDASHFPYFLKETVLVCVCVSDVVLRDKKINILTPTATVNVKFDGTITTCKLSKNLTNYTVIEWNKQYVNWMQNLT